MNDYKENIQQMLPFVMKGRKYFILWERFTFMNPLSFIKWQNQMKQVYD